MKPKILLDEDTRDRDIWKAIKHHNASRPDAALDVLRVGDKNAPPLGTQDDDLIRLAAAAGRIIVSHDADTLVEQFYEYLNSGCELPGLIIMKRPYQLGRVVEDIALIVCGYDPDELINQCFYVPLT